MISEYGTATWSSYINNSYRLTFKWLEKMSPVMNRRNNRKPRGWHEAGKKLE
jgi:hypothetical protein